MIPQTPKLWGIIYKICGFSTIGRKSSEPLHSSLLPFHLRRLRRRFPSSTDFSPSWGKVGGTPLFKRIFALRPRISLWKTRETPTFSAKVLGFSTRFDGFFHSPRLFDAARRPLSGIEGFSTYYYIKRYTELPGPIRSFPIRAAVAVDPRHRASAPRRPIHPGSASPGTLYLDAPSVPDTVFCIRRQKIPENFRKAP